MKKLIIVLFLLIPTITLAESCYHYDYAELIDMDKQTLEQEYCKNHSIGYLLALSSLSPQNNKNSQMCNSILMQIARIYSKKFDMPEKEVYKYFRENCQRINNP